jgi:hypothetical protein
VGAVLPKFRPFTKRTSFGLSTFALVMVSWFDVGVAVPAALA